MLATVLSGHGGCIDRLCDAPGVRRARRVVVELDDGGGLWDVVEEFAVGDNSRRTTIQSD